MPFLFPSLWILLGVALLVSAVGFYRFIYFISLGYGFSVAALGIAMLAIYGGSVGVLPILLCALLILYGLRLGGYLLIRELKSKSYAKILAKEAKGNGDYPVGVRIAIWVSCAALYLSQTSPILYRLQNGVSADAMTIIGGIVMVAGLALETAADLQKTALKKKNPGRFCDTGLFKLVRCPNYFGEMLFWTGVLLTGLPALSGAGQWIVALVGYAGIIFIMFSGARRLELRQNKNYGSDPEYQAYVKRVPILLPFVPLYSVEKYKFLVA